MIGLDEDSLLYFPIRIISSVSGYCLLCSCHKYKPNSELNLTATLFK